MIAYDKGQSLGKFGCSFLRELSRMTTLTGRSIRMAEFLCSCSRTFTASIGNVKSDQVRSCGCLRRAATIRRSTKHGMSPADKGTRIYRFWQSMKDRCLNSKSTSYMNYGGRGISMHSKWVDDFPEFYDYFRRHMQLTDMPDGFSIDRIDNNGDYAPGNLRLATSLVQCNNKRSNHWLEFRGQRMTLAQVARTVGIKSGTLWNRLMLQHRSIEEAIAC